MKICSVVLQLCAQNRQNDKVILIHIPLEKWHKHNNHKYVMCNFTLPSEHDCNTFTFTNSITAIKHKVSTNIALTGRLRDIAISKTPVQSPGKTKSSWTFIRCHLYTVYTETQQDVSDNYRNLPISDSITCEDVILTENKTYVAYSTAPYTMIFTNLLNTPLQTLGWPVISPSQSQESKYSNLEDTLHDQVLNDSV